MKLKFALLLALLCASAALALAHTVTLTWNASPTTGVTYNVYRGTATGVCFTTKIASGVSALTFTDSTVTNGATYFYAVSAQNSGGESATCTSEVQVLIPQPPLPPSNLAATVQ